MTEEAVRRQFDVFIERMDRYVSEEVNPLNTIDSRIRLPKGAVNAALRPFVRREVDSVGSSFERKFSIVVDCAGGDSVEERRDEYLHTDAFYVNADAEVREELGRELIESLRTMADNIRPLVESEKDSFWDAVVDVYDEEGAKRAIRDGFDYSKTARKYADDVDLTVTVRAGLLSKEIEYTDEAVRALTVAEKRLRRDVTADIEQIYT
ncbi:MAG: hypothetical protein U5J64_12625 [Halobacteriales archaeon]|nr:hypothetical protein [Halobacteriales archaeon]